MAAFPPEPVVELLLDGGWVDITQDARVTETIAMSRGRADEASQADPGKLGLKLNNRHGKYSPRNPLSPYYGQLTRNTPIRVRVREDPDPTVLWVPGQDEANASTPATAGLQITGDLDVRLDVDPGSWRPTLATTLISRYLLEGDNRSWVLRVLSDGALQMNWSPDGTFGALQVRASTVAVPDDGERRAVRVTLDVDDAGNNTTTFYTAETIDGPWTQLGDAVASAGTTAVHGGSADVEIGTANDGSTGLTPGMRLVGAVYAAQILDGIDGTPGADVDFTALVPGATSVTDQAGAVWTVSGAEVETAGVQPFLVDTFARTDASAWGTADTGQTWGNPFTASTPPAFSVDGSAGVMEFSDATEIGNQLTVEDQPADFDATFAVSVDQVALGNAAGAVFVSLRGRAASPGTTTHVRFSTGFRVDTGKVDGSGLRVSTSILAFAPGAISLTSVSFIPGLTYAPGERLRVRCQAVGPEVRMRVWAEGSPEPTVWHSQGYTEDVLAQGCIGVRAAADANAADTSMPLTVEVSDLEVRPHVAPSPLVRYVGEVSSWPPRWDLSDSDIWVPLQAAGILRRLGQGQKPLQSPLRRAIPTELPPAYWPLEDGPDTTLATSVVDGIPPLQVSGLRFGEDDTLISSDPLPIIGPGGARIRAAATTADTGSWEANLLYNLEFFVPTEDQELLGVTTSTATWSVFLAEFDDRPTLWVRVRDLEGDLVHESNIFADVGDVSFFDAWRRLRLRAVQDGSNVDFGVSRLDDDGGTWGFSGSFSGTVGHITGIDTTFGSELEDMGIGHLTVWGVTAATAYFSAFGAFRRTTAETPESTRERLNRLETDAGVPILVEGAADTQLGAQARGTFLDAVTEAQAPDLGVAGELRHQVGLSYRGRDTLYNQTPKLVLDYTSGVIHDPIEPTDDDQATRNDVEVKRARGATVAVVDQDGPLGINTVGRYDESTTLSLASDTQIPDQAGWRLHLGTIDELRFPVIHLNLAGVRTREHIDAVLALDAGDRVQILNPPAWVQSQTVDLIVQGYSERIGAYRWDIELVCTPASPWTVGEVADDLTVESDADTTASDTTVTVTGARVGDLLIGAQLWDFDEFANMPAAPTPGTWTLITSATAADDDCHVKVWTREVTEDGDQEVTFPLGSGTDPDNHAHLWLVPGGASSSVVADSAVQVAHTFDHVAPSVDMPDAGVILCGWVGQGADGEYTLPSGMVERATSAGSFSTTVAATERVGSGTTGTRTAVYDTEFGFGAYTVGLTLEAALPDDPGRADTAGSALAFDIDDAETTLSVSTTTGPTWAESADYPDDFPFHITVGGEVMQVEQVIGDGSSLPQTVEVTRAINGITKSHEAGAAVRLAQAATVAL